MAIKEKRIAAGMSQEQLAEASGVTRASISRYENGERRPNVWTAIKIARALRCTVEDLLTERTV